MTHDRLSQSLLRAAKHGDNHARAALVDATREDLTRHVRNRLGSHLRNRVTVDDVLQETYARALESLPVFQWRSEDSFLRWLKGIASNEVLRQAKRERRRNFIAIESDDVAAGDVSPSRAMRRGERLTRLERALDGLSHEHREVIRLARLEGLPLAVVGERMGRAPNAAAQLLGRALTNLKASFGDTESLGLPRRTSGASGDREACDER